MNNIVSVFRRDKTYKELSGCLFKSKGKRLPVLVSGLCEGARNAFYAATLADRKSKVPALAILASEKEVSRLSSSLAEQGIGVMTYTLRDMVLQNIIASHEFERDRIAVLDAVMNNKCDIVLTTPDAALQLTMPPKVLSGLTDTVSPEKQYDPDALCAFLAECGYTRTDMVDSVGQYSRRGGIIDLFTPGTAMPVRMEFFDTEIDRMACFDVISQRYTDAIDCVSIMPVREVIANDEQKKLIADEIKALARKSKDNTVKQHLYSEVEGLESGRELNCIDKYISMIYPEKVCLLDYFTADSLMFIQEYNAVSERARSFEWQDKENTVSLLSSGMLSQRCAEFSKPQSYLSDCVKEYGAILINTFTTAMSGLPLDGSFSFSTRQTANCFDNLPVLYETIYDYKQVGYYVYIACENTQSVKNLKAMLSESGYDALTESDGYGNGFGVTLITSPNTVGFESTTLKFAVISTSKGVNTSQSNIRRGYKVRGKTKGAAEKIFSYIDLDIGDYVVHEKYGIGQYLGTQSMLVGGVRRDFVQIKYFGTDMLYLPCNQLDMLSKYIGSGGEDREIKLSKMGGNDWVKAKTKVKAAAKEMAKELIAIYAARLRKPGYAFPPDTSEDAEFADNFEYDETPGQLAAIEDIKRDMESPHPMERLLCGDVGYGKTEVALRAAFKAVCDGKQVAILVPTTILALQHYETLLSRMRGFPINVDMLSRFRTAKEQAVSLRKLSRGETDIIVGTHRLLSKDIEFRNLGLVIVDEEQRFGVVQKEKLKQIAENVDILTLTATPIPRTLNMAMSGIRDMSLLEEAPGDRFPVQSYVTEYDEQIIFDAIRREMRRGGQVFYLCNRVERMERCAGIIAKEIPEARIAIANGQMEKDDLSEIWHSLLTGETDILVCTTIIETGVDVPNANTLIIEDADKMGLSQLHQLRGRVGRSSRRAYAYFTYPHSKVLSEIATKRLSAIRDFTEFGAGFKVAMRDLEIRGAGNILGAEQHGNMASIGYELYMRLLEEAILEEKGEKPKQKYEASVDFSIDAYVPEKYIENPNHRLEAYKKISLIRNYDDVVDVNDELLDRYGAIPQAVSNLVNISYLRATASVCRLRKVEYKDRTMFFYPDGINIAAWSALAAKHNGKLLLSMGASPYISCRVKNPEYALDIAIKLLKDYLAIVSSQEESANEKKQTE